jgi:hypothetical protein
MLPHRSSRRTRTRFFVRTRAVYKDGHPTMRCNVAAEQQRRNLPSSVTLDTTNHRGKIERKKER